MLLAHKKWDGSQYAYKNTNLMNAATYLLLAHKIHKCKDAEHHRHRYLLPISIQEIDQQSAWMQDHHTTDTTTYSLSAHKKWNSSQHECKATNTTDIATYILLAYKE